MQQAGGGADLHDAALPGGDGFQQGPGVGLDEQAVVLLVLGAPDLQHAHGLVAQRHLADVDRGAQRVDDLLDLQTDLPELTSAKSQ